MAEGYITIETELATDKFDKQIMDLEKKIKKKEDKKIELEANLSIQEQNLESLRKQSDELGKIYQKMKKLQDKLSTGKGTPQEYSLFSNLEKQYGNIDQIGLSLDKIVNQEDIVSAKVDHIKNQYNEITTEVDEYKSKIEGIRLQKHQSEISKVKEGFKSIGSSIQDAVKRVGKLVLGIFAIRSAYMALRSASSYLSQYDEQYSANLEYIRYVLTQAIAPVLRGIVQLAMQLLQLINTIVNSLFGINLFSKGSAESFQKMKAGASGVNKAVKEIKKQLLGFDEINMLTDQSDTGTSAGAGGVKMPDMDLSQLQGETPKWMQWILEHGPELISTLTMLGVIIGGLKIASLLKGLGLIASIPIQSIIGIGVAVGSIVYAIMALIDYLKDPSLKNFGKIIQGIGGAIIGLGIAVASVPAVVTGAVVLIFGTIVKYWDKIKQFIQKGIDWLKSKTDWIKQHFGIVGEAIYNVFTQLLQSLLNIFDSIINGIKNVFDGLIKFIKGVFTQDWQMAWEGVKQIFTSIFNAIKGVIQSVWEFVKTMFSAGGKIFTGIVEGIVGAFKAIVNALIWGINKLIAVPFNLINGILNKIKSVEIIGIKPFDGFWGWNPLPVPQIPTLKTGGIINMPNKGTMVGGMAIGGEAGREGVVPLTDQQAMAELGREIGKNVLVNLTNITSMNGRIISRELKQVQSNQEFAYNM